MSRPNQSSVQNQLLALLSPADYALLQPHLEAVTLDRSLVLAEPNELIAHAVFPDSGLGSIVAVSPEGHQSEVGIFGRDGMAGIALVLGVDRTPQQTVIQSAGAGHRVVAGELQRLVLECQGIREVLLHYEYALSTQTSHTALSNATHTVEERLARWLLMSHDRTEGDEIALTHEFLSLMLVVRRPSVTTALHVLEGMRLIWSKRGRVIIRDRMGLEALAADAYGIPEAEYERLIGPLRKQAPKPETSEENDDTVVPFKRD